MPPAAAISAMLSEEVVVARSASGQASAMRREQLALGRDLLDDRLDDDVAVGEVLGVGGDPQPRGLGALDLGAGGDDFLLGAPGRGLAAGEQDRVGGGRRDRGEAGGDRPAARDPRTLVPLARRSSDRVPITSLARSAMTCGSHAQAPG